MPGSFENNEWSKHTDRVTSSPAFALRNAAGAQTNGGRVSDASTGKGQADDDIKVADRREALSSGAAAAGGPGQAADPASAGFAFRFGEGDRSRILADSSEAIRGLVPVIRGLSDQPSLSPQAQGVLSKARSELQGQMNLYALASDQPSDLRASGLMPSQGFELNLRIAEAYRKGADDLGHAPEVRTESLISTPTEASQELRRMSPDKADRVLDSAIAMAGMRHLDTTGLMSDRERANAVAAVSAGDSRYGFDLSKDVKDKVRASDWVRPWDQEAQRRRTDANYGAGNFTLSIQTAARMGQSAADRTAMDRGRYEATGRENYGDVLAEFAGIGAGVAIARGAQRVPKTSPPEIANPEALKTPKAGGTAATGPEEGNAGVRADLHKQVELKNQEAVERNQPKPYPDVDAEVEGRMAGWEQVRERSFPNGFKDKEAFEAFKQTITSELKKFGAPADDIGVHGSAVNKPDPGDIDVAVRVDQATFDKLVNLARLNRGPGTMKTIANNAANGIMKSYYLPNIDGKTFPQAIYGAAGDMKVQASFILKGGPFDIGPYLKF